jgi:hydroxypyruvate isomerase
MKETRMLSRRTFGGLLGGTLAMRGWAQTPVAGDLSGRFSVMIWVLKSRGTFDENLDRVAQAGFRHVELVGESLSWSAAERDRLMAKMTALGITVDASTGMKTGFAIPGTGDAFLSELKGFIVAMKGVGCRRLILMSGKRVDGMAQEAQRAVAVENLRRAAEVLEAEGMDAVIEPIDRLENPPIWLDGVEEGFEIVRQVASPRVKVLYDLYHEQRTKGNLIEKLRKNIDAVGLIHVADVPGRHEPGTGEMDYGNIYRAVKELKYSGMIAMEFYPTGDIVEGLRKARLEAEGLLK